MIIAVSVLVFATVFIIGFVAREIHRARSTKTCPHCRSRIDARASVCPSCRREPRLSGDWTIT